ncbi:DUF3126 family protein [Teichococcus vastitatis]|jgi:hypothetical protein|uniref:DUF3126 family protein n=1 Tax=Teichococcus vastitatis TaxID=2307076 RepID=A0ABS9W0E0_9PROT|nr:DUF3126 family protein [Pseudoroseomonas vastitatis]MCI0752636.1 DUF3126 family protein [Pseudoroseomonas vastitatis]
MDASDIARVQAYLRRILGSERVTLIKPARAGLSVEVAVQDEVIGTVHRDDDEGEVSYSVHLTILEEDLPPLPKAATAAPRRRI